MAIDIHETPVDPSLMQELRPLAKRLSAASDELNQALLIIQDKLNALALSVEEWVPDSCDPVVGQEGRRQPRTGMGRISARLCLDR